MQKRPFIVLTGPTAVGKSDLSIKLCKAINGAVISADSMQVYRMMDIGSAKISREEMSGVDHYLIDCLDPKESFNIAIFKDLAKKALDEIYNKGQIPVIVGGTGFYIQSLLYDVSFSKEEDVSSYRLKYEEFVKENGNHSLHELLKDIDPESYEGIHENNVKRVIRALEFYDIHQYPISKHNEEEKAKKSPYNFAYFVLNDEREVLYNRIDQRVDVMIDKGLVEEVKMLKEYGCTKDFVSMQGLGYKEILDYLDGAISLEEAAYIIKRDSRHFAKRQLTWFNRERDVIWVNKNEFGRDDDQILGFLLEKLKEKNIYE